MCGALNLGADPGANSRSLAGHCSELFDHSSGYSRQPSQGGPRTLSKGWISSSHLCNEPCVCSSMPPTAAS